MSEDRINYREVLRKNKSKTTLVVGLFLLLYSSVGYIIDIFLQWPKIIHSNPERYRGLWGMFNAIADGNVLPYATVVMCLIGIVSVLVTFRSHDKMIMWGSEYDEIDLNDGKQYSVEERTLYNIIEELKISANLGFMPKVYLIRADYMNAFASGYSEKSAMVAITEGLMSKLTRSELQAVMAHEVSHIKHLDIKLTLFIGVLSNVMLMVLDMLVDVARFTGGGTNSKDDKDSGNAKLIILLILLVMRLIFPFLAFLLQLNLSRTREYMADAGAVKITRDREAMATALLKIHQDYSNNEYEDKGVSVRKAAYIYNPIKSLFGDSFSTHPSIEARVKALGMRRLLREYNIETQEN